MSELKTNKVSPATGTALAVGDSGDTITVPSGATFTVSGTMNASSITAGTVATARLGSGTADATTFLRGDQSYAAAGGGKVLQVIHITDAGPGTTTTSTSFIDTDTTGSITCSATSSKVLVMFGGSCTGYRASDANQYTGPYRLYETATTTAYPSTDYFARGALNGNFSQADNRFGTYVGGAWLHSPSSTSALTYTVQIKKGDDSTYWNETSGETATMTLMEIGA